MLNQVQHDRSDMKIYVAARFFEKDRTKKIYRELKKRGHAISADWTPHKQVKPYSRNVDIAKAYSIEDVDGVRTADAFILLTSEQTGSGSSTELGIAIESNIAFGKPTIYVVGPYFDGNFCYYYPSVKRMDTIEEVYKDLLDAESSSA